MKAILILAIGLFLLAGCDSNKPTMSYHYTHPPCPVDTVKICPPSQDSCKDVPDCNENGNCQHDKDSIPYHRITLEEWQGVMADYFAKHEGAED